MTAALILIAVLILAGAVLRLFHRAEPEPEEAAAEEAGRPGCCGLHLVCERDSLLAAPGEMPEYYADEELDEFAGRAPESYLPSEAELFRDVLLTLRPDEIAGWARSISLRGIQLPADVRDELLMIVTEARAKR